MKLRHIPALALVAATAALAGCGKSDADAPAYKIGISIPSADHGWTGGVVYHANAVKSEIEAAHPDVKVLVSTAATSGEQVDRVENLLVQGIDALVILPSEPAPLTPICEKAARQGVKLVVVDRNLANPIQDLLVAGDNPGFGRVGAEVIAKELGGQGAIVVMEGIPCDVNSQRVDAFKAVVAQHPGLAILESGASDWSTEKGLKLMENFLQKHPTIDAVWTGDDDVSVGALKAYEESRRTDVKILVGGGGSKAIVKRILDNDPLVKATVTYPPAMIAVGAREAVKIVKGAPVENPRIVVPAEIVTPENAADFYFPESAY
ncbi:MAG: substrate-binding domain-containing protein [Kiritimatiellia bacterium]|jgi:ribose transport system substrate-binding protein